MKIFIMAQGKGSRWEGSERFNVPKPCEYKQVLPITEDLNLISRTIRQMHFFDPIVICNGDMERFLPDWSITQSLKEPTQCLLHGITETHQWWGNSNQVIFMLGDVAYSNSMVSKILNYPIGKPHYPNVAIFGRRGANQVTGKDVGEIFAISVHHRGYEEFMGELHNLIRSKGTKLWDYRNEYHPIIAEIDGDYTDDTDSLKAYEKFWPTLREAIIEDDKEYKEYYEN